MREKNIPGQKNRLMERSSGRDEFVVMKKQEGKQINWCLWVRKGSISQATG